MSASKVEGSVGGVVDGATYDLLQALISKLEAIEVYEQYAENGDRELSEEMLADERRRARLRIDTLRERLSTAST